MKSSKLPVITALSLAAMAFGQVAWTITGPAQVTPGQSVDWQASVAVAGSNAGLAGYAFNIVVGLSPGPEAGADGAWGTADDVNVATVTLAPATFVPSFAVGGSGPAGVNATLSAGGPGMDVLASTGSAAVHSGELLQVGAGYLAWNPAAQAAGVGRDEAKATLLASPAGAYVLNAGSIPTAGLAPGTYTVLLAPVATRVLRPDADYGMAHSGFLMINEQAAPASFEFTIPLVPVPGDFTSDGYVNAADLSLFIACSAGPEVPYAAGCELPVGTGGFIAADFDEDADVDSADFAVFQRCLSFDQPGDPGCAG